jgi:hypothetical protein
MFESVNGRWKCDVNGCDVVATWCDDVASVGLVQQQAAVAVAECYVMPSFSLQTRQQRKHKKATRDGCFAVAVVNLQQLLAA